uniref:Bm109 n=1 Tax=Brugia malayi TaxID=6279 RepID=A0A1I9FZV1_BRUMA|nr:Bm109 [Brugia malayi]
MCVCVCVCVCMCVCVHVCVLTIVYKPRIYTPRWNFLVNLRNNWC